MISVEQALEMLQKEGITNSIQMVRRWLRAGKIEGASQQSKKTGWEIPLEGLNQFIELKKAEPVHGTSTIKESEDAYQKGYHAALKEIKKRDRELLQIKGVSENSFYIYRNELMQLGERLVNPQFRKEFKKFLDLSLFKKYVKNPRQRLEVLQLGEWCMIWETKNLFDRSTFEDVNLALEDKFVNALLEKMKKKFLEERRKK